jgi:uncharacterized phage-associated protein
MDMDKVEPNIVADWLIAWHGLHGDGITNLRLQKLMYYVQSWYIALNDDKPIFQEDFQAWIHGPVLPSQYHRFKEYGPSFIPVPAIPGSKDESGVDLPKIDSDISAHMEEVMEVYGTMTTWDLERLSHLEDPWIESRGGISMDDICRTTIAKKSIGSYYRSLLPTGG